MPQSKITFIVNNNTYQLSVDNIAAIRSIPKADREPLITLLEAVKKQDKMAQIAVQQAIGKAQAPLPTDSITATTATSQNQGQTNPTRLSSGDADDLMARLILEERRNQKPGLTPQSLYKFIAGFVLIVMVLIYIF